MSEVKTPNKLKLFFKSRWYGEDYPGVKPRFQVTLFAKDLGVFLGLPIAAVILFKSCETAIDTPRTLKPRERARSATGEIQAIKSQIITFGTNGKGIRSALGGEASAGTLVRVRLLNVVETYASSPVFAQIIDAGLGSKYIGATLIGEGVADAAYGRVTVQFNLLRDPKTRSTSKGISARALSLNGTLGIEGKKKEGFFARGALNASSNSSGLAQGAGEQNDVRSQFLRALAMGMLQEFDSEAQVQKNRAQVLSLQPSTEFFAELTDSFPRSNR